MRWISLGILVAAGVLLALFWGDVPDRWITHWGADGPDRWAAKSVAAAMAPLAVGLFTWLLLEAAAIWTSRRGPAMGYPPELAAVHVAVVRALGLSLSLLIAGLTLGLPFLRPRSPLPIVLAALADLGVVVGAAMIWAARRTRLLREAGVAIPDGYHGALYSNPRDARLWVPKVVGIGWTLNFAHRFAWPVILGLVGAPLVLIVALVLAGR